MARARREGDARTEGDVARPKRVPMHEQRNRLSTKPKKGWVRRWFINRNNRLHAAQLAGYRLVPKGEAPEVGDEQVLNTSVGIASYVATPASGSNEDRLVLMEIPEELYAADQKAKQLEVDKKEQDLLRQLNRGSAHSPTEEDGGLTYGQAGPSSRRIGDPADARVFGRRGR